MPESATSPLWEAARPEDVFSGTTLTAAVAAATRARGEDVQITAARSVRQGLSGLTGKTRYEVLTGSSPLQVEAEVVETDIPDSFALLVQEALDRVQLTEMTVGETADLVETFELPQQRAAAPKPAAKRAPAKAPARAPAKSTAKAPVKASAKKAEPVVAEVAAAHCWSRPRLLQVGVPRKIIDSIVITEGASDLAWASALATAIELHVPAPASLGDGAHAVVTGVGCAGAVLILKAGCAGVAPGVLVIDGRNVAATATELALAVRELIG